MRCFQRTEEHGSVLCSSASISIPLATYTKRQEFCTYAIECFDLNMCSDHEKLLCRWHHLLREPIWKKREKCRLLQRGRERSLKYYLMFYIAYAARIFSQFCILLYSRRCKIYWKHFYFWYEVFKLPWCSNLPFSPLFVTFCSILRPTMIVF